MKLVSKRPLAHSSLPMLGAALLLSVGPATAQPTAEAPLAASTDPLACAGLINGVPIRIGSPVLDTAGQDVGSVSLSQCFVAPESAKLRVRLRSSLGGEVKVFDLEGVKTDGFAVTLPLTNDEIAGLPTASDNDGAVPRI